MKKSVKILISMGIIIVILVFIGICYKGKDHNDNTSDEAKENLINTRITKEVEDGIYNIVPITIAPKTIDNLYYNVIGKNIDNKAILFGHRYTELEGITTFRGNNYRSSPSYGISNIKEKKLQEQWKFNTSSGSWGGGSGWTGQPSIIKWPEDIKKSMNIKDELKNNKDFTEVIYASLDGNIYFLDLETGKPSREKIKVGNPIKGTLTIDPRGLPLLYIGEGIPENGTVGLNIFSLIDGKKLFELDGYDGDSYRTWPAFDSSPLINGDSDTLIEGGENGILYLMKLNSRYDKVKNTISVDPKITKYRYKVGTDEGRLGIENSVAVYANLIYFADNNGYIQCVNLNDMKPVWLVNGLDDTDGSLTIDVENKTPFIYCGNEVDHQGIKGICKLRKINGFTGEIIWEKAFTCESIIGDNAINGGLLATNIVGKNKIQDKVIFSLARYKGFNKGAIIAMKKNDGTIAWETEINDYMWSSPVDFYDEDGNCYIIQCDSAGHMLLIEGDTGKILTTLTLNGNIEATPAIFKDNVVVATRNGTIYKIKIK